MNLATITTLVTCGTATVAVATQTVGVFINAPEAMPGCTLFAPQSVTTTYLIDNDGNEVHAWPSDAKPGESVYLLDDGDLMRTASPSGIPWFTEGGAGGRIDRIAWDGTLVWSFDHASPDYRQHHDIAVLPSGNVLAISWRKHSRPQAIAAGRDPDALGGVLWSESIIEIEPSGATGGTIVWEWHAWDHLVQSFDATLPNYGDAATSPGSIDINWPPNDSTVDWLHINAIDYNAALDQIALSCPRFNEVWIIDHGHSTADTAGPAGDLIYRWGNPQAYGRGAASDRMLFFQHDVKWIESDCPGAGDMTVYNNGAGRPDGAYSSIEQFTPPLEADGTYTLDASSAWGPSAANWTWTADPPESMYSNFISGAQRLPNGNTLMCVGASGRFIECAPALGGAVAWEYISPVTQAGMLSQGDSVAPNSNSVFRATRLAVDHPGLDGHDLTPGDPLEGPGCLADISGGNGIVDVADLLLIIEGWGTDGPGADLASPEDVIDTSDVLAMRSQWGQCP